MRKRLLIVMCLMAACVKQSTYDKALDDNKKLKSDLEASQKKQSETES
jgi:hypothetical protein